MLCQVLQLQVVMKTMHLRAKKIQNTYTAIFCCTVSFIPSGQDVLGKVERKQNNST